MPSFHTKSRENVAWARNSSQDSASDYSSSDEDEEEVEDEHEYTDCDLEGVEEHKSIILHLLSQLKLGMDLTKVSVHYRLHVE